MPGVPTSSEAPPLLRISCDRYHAMIERGVLSEEDRIELIDGYLIQKISISPSHSGTVNRLMRLLISLLGDRAVVAVQNPITIHEFSEPEPDIVVAKYREDFYDGGHPMPEDIYFVVEVADSSLAFDRETKIPLYASCGIRATWLVDLKARELTVYSDPTDARYSRQETFRAGNTVILNGIEGVAIDPADFGL